MVPVCGVSDLITSEFEKKKQKKNCGINLKKGFKLKIPFVYHVEEYQLYYLLHFHPSSLYIHAADYSELHTNVFNVIVYKRRSIFLSFVNFVITYLKSISVFSIAKTMPVVLNPAE